MNTEVLRNPVTETPGLDRQLMEAARSAARHAYVPYSGFPVGAAVLTDTGDIVAGVNIENASIGLTTCGERVAIQTAAAMGHRSIVAVAVSAPRAPGTTPCGACRQVMNEFKPATGEMVVLIDNHDSVTMVTLSDLLPMSFGPRDLERAV
jgi:cytidine deaminase